MKAHLSFKKIIIITLAVCILPEVSRAMSISVLPPSEPLRVGDTSLLRVVIDTDQQEINAIDGSVIFERVSDITSVSTGGSILSLWPHVPTIEGDMVSYTGGTPSGVFGKNLRLFTLAVTPKSAEALRIRIPETRAYLNDGDGTAVLIPSTSVEIPVSEAGATNNNALSQALSLDTEPPLPFTIDIGREASLYDSKYFISFFATDTGSGIQRYEVTEDTTVTTVKEGEVYVLKNQNNTGKISVTAIDNAGNERTEVRNFSNHMQSTLIPILLAAMLALVGILIALHFFIIRKK